MQNHITVLVAYMYGQGVEREMTKATYYYELAAIMGSAIAW